MYKAESKDKDKETSLDLQSYYCDIANAIKL